MQSLNLKTIMKFKTTMVRLVKHSNETMRFDTSLSMTNSILVLVVTIQKQDIMAVDHWVSLVHQPFFQAKISTPSQTKCMKQSVETNLSSKWTERLSMRQC